MEAKTSSSSTSAASYLRYAVTSAGSHNHSSSSSSILAQSSIELRRKRSRDRIVGTPAASAAVLQPSSFAFTPRLQRMKHVPGRSSSHGGPMTRMHSMARRA